MNSFPLQRLTRIVNYAFVNSLFYRHLYERKPQFKNYKEFQALPIITPRHLSENWNEFLSVPRSKISRIYVTSGTTKLYKGIWLTPKDVENGRNDFIQMMKIVGIDAGCGVMPILSYGPTAGGREVLEAFEKLGAKTIPVSIYTSELAIPLIEKFNVNVIFGLPSVLLRLGSDYKGKSVEKLIVIGELLTPCMRTHLKNSWNVEEVYNVYGALDGGGIGAECYTHSGIHIIHTSYFIEILDSKRLPIGAGEIGQVILTNLKRQGIPLIRYEIGDVARKLNGKCHCGLNSPKIQPMGRNDEVIIAGGSLIYPSQYSEAIYSCFDKPTKFMIDTQKDKLGREIVSLEILTDQNLHISRLKKRFIEELSKRNPDFAFAVKKGWIKDVKVSVSKMTAATKSYKSTPIQR